MRTFYDRLSVAPDAPPEEIKKAFRREIARYHPDKVQHLGPEFQDMAAGIAADLTEAYRVLMDPELRAKYDEDLRAGPPAPMEPPVPPPAGVPAPPPPPRPVSPSPPPYEQAEEPVARPPRPRATPGLDLVRRAALAKIHEAIEDVLGIAEPLTAPAFDVAVVTRPKRSLFRKADEAICLAVKFVPVVDAAAIADIWGPASRLKAPRASECAVILLGQLLAPPSELSAAIKEQLRKARGSGPLLVPVDVRDWEAFFPPETPGAIRSLIQRLRDGKQ